MKKHTPKIILVCIIGAVMFMASIALTEKCYSYISQNYCVDMPENVLCSPNYGVCMIPFIIAISAILFIIVGILSFPENKRGRKK
jgi:uncharacterized membrane protein